MGGRGKSRTQRKHFKQSRDNVWKRTKSEENTIDDNNNTNNEDTKPNPSWQPLVTDNPAFEDYYKEQGIVGTEEWEAFMGCLRTALPAAFRINSSGQFCTEIREQLENDFAKSLQTESIDGSELEAIKPLPWYPENLAWHSNYSRKQLRKNQTLERFHEFLKLQNEIGNITRQEAVSMVPPLFLDVHPDHFVLDMCAAPGSKTFQLLEMIHSVTKPGSLPNGMVVANDLDVQRCNLLIHQTKRMCTANLIVTTNEAQHFPGCNLSKNRVYMKDHHDMMHLQFDRVLCDVPCSGDGTLRKAPDIWRKWNSGMGNGLHSLQVQIAMRGLSLLKVGGRMVYSTCSMNPVENEAVVAEILRRCGGSVELIDVSNEFTKLIRRPGLKTWKVRDRGVWLNSYKEVPELRKGAIFPSMFPSGKSKFNDQDETEEVTDLPLERCMRIVPHDQNTGAFFIVVLQKLSPLPNTQKKSGSYPGQLKVDSTENIPLQPLTEVKEDSETVLDTETCTEPVLDSETRPEPDLDSETRTEPVLDSETRTEKAGDKRKLPSQGRWTGVDPVIFYKDETVTNQIKDFYGINDSFPFNGHLVTRNSDAGSVKRIYYVSKSVKNAIELNLSAGQQLKIASVGIKMFERQTSKEGANTPCLFRISSEGLPLLLPHITKQILYASPMDFKHLLEYKSIKFGEFVNPGFGETVDKLMMGCCIVVLNKDKGVLCDVHEVNGAPIAIGCWRGRNNLAVMVTSLDCQELLERVTKYMEEIKQVSSMEEIKNESVLKEEVTEPIVG